MHRKDLDDETLHSEPEHGLQESDDEESVEAFEDDEEAFDVFIQAATLGGQHSLEIVNDFILNIHNHSGNVNRKDAEDLSALLRAIEVKDSNIVTALLAVPDVNIFRDGYPALILAALYGCYDIFISVAAKINDIDDLIAVSTDIPENVNEANKDYQIAFQLILKMRICDLSSQEIPTHEEFVGAVRSGDEETVTKYIDVNENIMSHIIRELIQPEDCTVLDIAVANGYANIVLQLMHCVDNEEIAFALEHAMVKPVADIFVLLLPLITEVFDLIKIYKENFESLQNYSDIMALIERRIAELKELLPSNRLKNLMNGRSIEIPADLQCNYSHTIMDDPIKIKDIYYCRAQLTLLAESDADADTFIIPGVNERISKAEIDNYERDTDKLIQIEYFVKQAEENLVIHDNNLQTQTSSVKIGLFGGKRKGVDDLVESDKQLMDEKANDDDENNDTSSNSTMSKHFKTS